ncbi:MAG: VCBS repeat-containing protein, partial [Planctomycetaceae bacterium]|nr:VCBS repeat-containing protein [Planctomycetaceae bacterium]
MPSGNPRPACENWCVSLVCRVLIPLALLSVIIVFWRQQHSANSAALVADQEANAERAFASGNTRAARRLAADILQRQPENSFARVLIAKCLRAEGRFAEALEALSDLPSPESPDFAEACCLTGDLLFFHLYRPTRAEKLYRDAVSAAPSSPEANDRLAILLSLTGRWWEQIPSRLAAVRAGRVTRLDLIVIALGDKALLNPEFASAMLQASPDDPLALLAGARLAVEEEQHDKAVRLLTRSLELAPDLTQADVLLGTILFQSGQEQQVENRLRQLRPSADNHPGIWTLRGTWAQQHSQTEVALRCFCEAIQRDPNHTDALYRAGTILKSMDRSDAAQRLLQRAARLQLLINAAKAAADDRSAAYAERAADLAESLGNYWEAGAWAAEATAGGADGPAEEMLSRLKRGQAGLPNQRTPPDRNPLATFDYRKYPLPNFVNDRFANTEETPAADITRNTQPVAQFSFRERSDIGLNFRYDNGSPDPTTGTRYMYEVMGGGVAAFDADGDDRPDLYFTQGGPWATRGQGNGFLDRLFLNRSPAGFADATDVCGIAENHFSQGAAVGDVDSDGFADILICNIGRNRLYCSNGDGTFRDATDEVPFSADAWSTSCAVADLSGDGHPELFVVNYLEGADIFTRTCGPGDRGVCLPQHFDAASDRLYLNEGNGQFRDITSESGIDVPEGKGLGIVVGAFDRSSRLNVFIANDTVPNFYFSNHGTSSDGVPLFQENALVSGLALNGSGNAQACMGIAAGDADGDGRADLFVTNFHGE